MKKKDWYTQSTGSGKFPTTHLVLQSGELMHSTSDKSVGLKDWCAKCDSISRELSRAYCSVDGSSTGWHSACIVPAKSDTAILRAKWGDMKGSRNVGAEAAAFLLGVQTLPASCNDVIFLADFLNSLGFDVGAVNYKHEVLVAAYAQVEREKAKMKMRGDIRWSHVHHPGHQKDTSWFTLLNLVADNLASCKMDVDVEVPVKELTNLSRTGKKGLASCKNLIEKYQAKAQKGPAKKEKQQQTGGASSNKRKANEFEVQAAAGGNKKQAVHSSSSAKKSKSILVVLPGASGKLSADYINLLLPALEESGLWDIRKRPDGEWTKGWRPKTDAVNVTEDLCPKDVDAEPWYVLGCSFGNRVATAIVSDALTPVAPGLILTGYPMYGDNGNEKRVEHIQKLPASARVLAISGEKDSCLHSQVPEGKPRGRDLWDLVVSGMACRSQTSVKYIAKGSHSVYESTKSAVGIARKNEQTLQILQWMEDFKQ